MQDKIEEEMTEEQKSQQKSLNELLGMPKRKVTKVFWSEIVEVKFEKANPEIIFFKYSYDEDFRKAVFSAPRRELRKKEMASRKAAMAKYHKPPGVSSQKKENLQRLCSKGLIPQRHHSFFNCLSESK